MLENKRVLTVDDSATIRLFLRSVLASSGAQVEEAATGEEALQKCRTAKKYDLILLDLLLPDADGIDILRQVREFDTESAIVMLTGMGGIKSATTAVRAGADGYMEKNDLISNGDKAEVFYVLA